MDELDYRRLCAWLEQQHQEALATLQRAYDENRRAIDTLWEQCCGRSSLQATTVFCKHHGSLIEAVRRACDHLGPSFTLQDVESLLRVEQPLLMAQSSRKSISTALRRLYEGRELVLIEEGRGTKPARYAVSALPRSGEGKEIQTSSRPS